MFCQPLKFFLLCIAVIQGFFIYLLWASVPYNVYNLKYINIGKKFKSTQGALLCNQRMQLMLSAIELQVKGCLC